MHKDPNGSARVFKVIGIDLQGQEIDADLSTPEGRQHAINTTLKLSNNRIDKLVLAAGVGGHIENGQLVAKVNYFGCIELLDGFKSALEKSNGRVVVISSNSAQMRTDPENIIIKHLLDGNETKAMEEIR